MRLLVNALKHKDLLVRVKAAEALGDIKNPKAVGPLIVLLKDEEETVRETTAKALENITVEILVTIMINGRSGGSKTKKAPSKANRTA